MRIPARAVLTAGTVLLTAGLLVGCTGSQNDARPSPRSTPTPTPVFTSDAEALAAATAIYTKYVHASDAIGHDGGANPERIGPFVSKAGLANEVEQANKLAAEHARETGYTRINNVILQSHTESNGVATVTIYACQDLSSVDVLDQNGHSLIASDRADFVAYAAELKSNSAGQLIVQSNKFWSGGGICKTS